MTFLKKHFFFAAFTAAFAALAAFVFWGTWSCDVSPVMPDNNIVHPMAYADVLEQCWRKFLSSGKLIPSDILWDGLLVSPYFCQELKYVVALYCAGLGLAYFLRGRGLRPLAAYGAGLLLAFCGYWSTLFSAGHGGWFVWMTYGTFAFGLVDRAVCQGRWRHWLLLGACLAWGSFNQPDLWLLFTAFTAVYFLWRCVRSRLLPSHQAPSTKHQALSTKHQALSTPPPAPSTKHQALSTKILASGLVFFVIGAPSFRHALVNDLAGRDKQIADGETVSSDVAARGDKDEQRWIFVTNWSLPPNEVAEFFVPRVNGDTSCPLTLSLARRVGKDTRPYTGALGRPKDAAQGNYRQHSLYVGWVTCLLALAGVVALFWRRAESGRLRAPTALLRNLPSERFAFCGAFSRSTDGDGCTRPTAAAPDIAFFAVAAVVFLLFSFGRYCEPVYRLVYALPFGDYLRAPVKWHHLTEFCLCVLAGYGIDGLLALKPLQNKVAVAILGAFVLFGAFDCARIDRLYCAPVDLTRVRRTNSDMQLSVLSRADFATPQVAEAVRRGRIVSLANYLGHPDFFLVEVLSPRTSSHDPLPPWTFPTTLGCLSLLGSLFVVFAASSSRPFRP